MVKKPNKKNFLLANKKFVLVLHFKKHAIRLTLASQRGVVLWKTSRSESFFDRSRVTRLTAQFLGILMGKQMLSLGVKSCEVGIKGPDYRSSFVRAILFAIVKHAKITIEKIDILSSIRFGGTKFPKRANRKGKGRKKKKGGKKK